MRRHLNTRLTFPLAVLACLALGASAGCVNKTEVNTARRSVYDTDFSRVYNAAVDAVREQVPQFDEDPSLGKISSAWRQVQFSNQADDPRSRSSDPTATFNGGGGGTPLSSTESINSRRYFIRFDVTVSGQRPWRVRVLGHASEWRAGDNEPTPMRGAAVPPWLPAREDALVVAIYRRLKAYAVAAPVEVAAPGPTDEPAVSASAFPGVDGGAATLLAALQTAIQRRDVEAIQPLLAADVSWSAGASPGVGGAMVILRADPGRLDRLGAALAAGCAPVAADATRVQCGPADAPLVVRQDGATWRVASFR